MPLPMPMLTTAPHLYIRRPSPTTAEFTVTTCPPLTLPLRLLLFALSLLRLVLLFAAVLTLHARLAHRLPYLSSTYPPAPAGDDTDALLLLHHHHHHHQHQQQQQQQQQQQGHHHAPASTADLAAALSSLDLPALVLALLALASRSRFAAALARLLAPVPDTAACPLAVAAAYAAVRARLHRTESVLVLRGLGIQTSTARGIMGGVGSFATLPGAGANGGGHGGSGGGGGGDKGETAKGGPKGVGGSQKMDEGLGGWLGTARSWLLGCLTAGWGAWGKQTRFIPTEKIRDVLINEAFRGFEVRYYLAVVVEEEEELVVLFPGLLPRRKIVEAVWRGIRGCLWEGEGWDERNGERGRIGNNNGMGTGKMD
ncbi:hypothetical protein VTJ83DRAFT_6563 [Remersonia thermophila]|uniref:Phosphatidylinositol N-acetylglucosaminyltransferase subunit H conserved domain-containing protein n=1 Tax=Remersonia thermophila TaxID=72144 RepID=A0ABR4D534_9PEZI